MTPAEKTDRARVAALRRHRPNDPKTHELAAKFKAERLAQHISRVVDSAPPLSQAQKDRLAVLLRGAV
jgi:ribosomal protein L4